MGPSLRESGDLIGGLARHAGALMHPIGFLRFSCSRVRPASGGPGFPPVVPQVRIHGRRWLRTRPQMPNTSRPAPPTSGPARPTPELSTSTHLLQCGSLRSSASIRIEAKGPDSPGYEPRIHSPRSAVLLSGVGQEWGDRGQEDHPVRETSTADLRGCPVDQFVFLGCQKQGVRRAMGGGIGASVLGFSETRQALDFAARRSSATSRRTTG